MKTIDKVRQAAHLTNQNTGRFSIMQKQQFRQAYRAARIGQLTADTLESVAAIISLQDARKPDLIGKVYRDGKEFMDFLECRHEKRERLAELKSRRRARRGDYRVDLPEEVAQSVDFDYRIELPEEVCQPVDFDYC